MAGFGNIFRRIGSRLNPRRRRAEPEASQSETRSMGAPASPAAIPGAFPGTAADMPAGPPGAGIPPWAEPPGQPPPVTAAPLPLASDAAAGAALDPSGTAVAVPPAEPGYDVGAPAVADDDGLPEDHLTVTCPYCGRVEQRIGARCDRCNRVIVRLPVWAQHRRRNWFLSRLSWRRMIFSLAVALIIVFLIWINFPFAPNPIILLKNIQTDMTVDTSAGVWSVAGRDLRNTRYISEGFPPPEGEIAWTASIPEPLNSEPVAQHGSIYVGSADGVYSLSERTGERRVGWVGETPGRINAGAAVVESYLFFGSTDHTVNSWNVLTGEAWWSFPAWDTVEVAPVVSDGLVYVSSGKGWLYALDAYDGSVIWDIHLDSDASGSVAVHDRRLFVGDDQGIFYILSARTGQERFRFRTLKTIAGAPVISADGERAFFPSSGQLYAVSAEQREVPGLFQFKNIWAQLWLWQVPGVPRPPGQQGGLWRYSPENSLQGIYSSPALVEEEVSSTLYVGGHDGVMYALNSVDGELMWTFRADLPIHASPLVVKDQLIFGDGRRGIAGRGNLYSINRDDGTENWRMSFASPITIPPIISGEYLIVRTEDGTIYGIK